MGILIFGFIIQIQIYNSFQNYDQEKLQANNSQISQYLYLALKIRIFIYKILIQLQLLFVLLFIGKKVMLTQNTPQGQSLKSCQDTEVNPDKIQQNLRKQLFTVQHNRIIIQNPLLKEVHQIQQRCSKSQIHFDFVKIAKYMSNLNQNQSISELSKQKLAILFQKQTIISLEKMPSIIKTQLQRLNLLYKIFDKCNLIQKNQKETSSQIKILEKQDVKNAIFQKARLLYRITSIQSPFKIKSFPKNQWLKNERVNDIIQKVILKIEKEIFINTIVAIQPIQNQNQNLNESQKQCRIYLQQCYPPILKKQNQIVNILGQKRFRNFVETFLSYKSNQEVQIIGELYKICHNCTKIIALRKNDGNQKSNCQYKPEKNRNQQLNCIYFFPNIYYRRTYELNFQRPFNNEQLQIIPYYISTKKGTGCGRFLCEECRKLIKKTKLLNCQFCQGSCTCKRCVLADKLSKIMSYWEKGNQQKIAKIMDRFIMSF